jgi:epoxyqueuosine reductase
VEDARWPWRFERWIGQTRIVRAVIRAGDQGHLWWIPPLPNFVLKRYGTEPRVGPKSLAIPAVPAELLTVPGIKRDPDREEAAFERGPLPDVGQWFPLHRPLTRKYMWLPRLMAQPRRTRAERKFPPSGRRDSGTPLPQTPPMTPRELTDLVKKRAAEIGISAVGVAPYDAKYVWEPFLDKWVGDRVVVCVLEQHYEATQSAPSLRAERAALAAYGTLYKMENSLADYIRELGYAAREGVGNSLGAAIHFGVEAGLGQLGLNGQLLTPFAGSRCRIVMINTDAPLAIDRPVDYGVTALCDECQVCIRRCPTGAISSKREYHRGVEREKIKIERCVPMVAQVHGCAVCMKVCPVQKYGLPAVLDHYSTTHQILGKGSDDLEGYDWPDGRRYGPGSKPRSAVSLEMLEPDGVKLVAKVPWPD